MTELGLCSSWRAGGPILLADDHRSFAQAIRVVMEGAGLEPVLVAGSVQDALKLAEGRSLGLVVSD